MAQFVQSIVQEVLQRNTNKTKFDLESKKDSPTREGSTPNKESLSKGSTTRKKTSNQLNNLENLNRPNYQKQNMERRLSPIVHQNRQFREETLSQLSTLALVRGEVEKKLSVPPKSKQVALMPECLGQTKNGCSLWFYPQLSDKLTSLLQAGQMGKAVGVLTSELYSPSLLFLLDQLMKENPRLHYHVQQKEEGKSFVLELYLDDASKLRALLQHLYIQLERKSAKVVEIIDKVSPSAWLSQQLKLPTSFGAISLVEGISYYQGLSILDQCVKQYPANSFQYQLKEHYLLFMGESTFIAQLTTELKQKI